MIDKLYTVQRPIRSRDSHLDTMKAILITLVVFGHCISNLFDVHSQCLFILIYSFHMPAWFMSSGIVFNTSYDFREFLKKKVNGLLRPIIGFVILLESYYLVMNFLQHRLPTYLTTHFSLNAIIRNILFIQNGSWGGLWYLPALFVLCLLGFMINKFFRSGMKWICIGVCAAVGFIMINYEVHMPFYGEISLIALPFFYLGKPIYCWIKKLNEAQRKQGLFLASICWLFIAVICLCNNNTVIEMASGKVGNPYLFYIIGTLGSICVMTVSQCIESIPIIQLIGRETLFIYGCHYPVVALSRFIIRRLIHTQNIIITTLISLLITILIISFLVGIRTFVNVKSLAFH